MILYAFIIIPVFAGLLVYTIPGKRVVRIVFGLQALLLAMSVYNFIIIQRDGPLEMVVGGFPPISGIILKCDTLAAAMMMMSSFIFLICFLFGLMDRLMKRKFIFFFLVLQSLVLTIFLSRDIFNVYVVTEVSTIIIAVLIMFKKDTRSMYDGLMYLVTNIAAMSFFLFGAAMIYKHFGTLNIDKVGAMMHSVENTKAMILPFALIMTGVSLKCAFIPLFNWLPNAQATPSAPSIVSVILSGLYEKCGIYLFIRFRAMFLPAINADNIFLLIGIATGIAGFMIAITKKDIKMILAYSTISQIGLILMGLVSGNSDAYYGAILHIFNHAVFKSLLFLFAGVIIDNYGTRDITKIRGVFKRMPFASIMAFAAMLGITGAPFFNGSVSKYLIESGFKGTLIEYAVILLNFGTILYFIKFSKIFFGKSKKENFSIDIWKNSALLVMGGLCLLMGLTGPIVIEQVFGHKIHLDFIQYIKNTGIFFASIAGGYFLYEKLLSKMKFVKKGVHLEPSVNGIGISLVGFFFFLTATVYFLV